MSEETNKRKFFTRSRLIAWAVAAAILVLLFIALTQILPWFIGKYLNSEREAREIVDLKVTSKNGKATLTLPSCVYDGDAFFVGDRSEFEITYMAGAVKTEDFYAKALNCPYYIGSVNDMGSTSHFYPASEHLTDVHTGNLYNLFLVKGHCFAINYKGPSENPVHYDSTVDVFETMICVPTEDVGICYFAFPFNADRTLRTTGRGTPEGGLVRYDTMIGFRSYEEMAQFYGLINNSLYSLDDVTKTIRVRLFNHDDKESATVAKLTFQADGVTVTYEQP